MYGQVASLAEHSNPHARGLANSTDGFVPQGAPGTVNANDYDLFRERYRLGKVFTMQQRGSTCFDFDYYRANSPDLPSALDAEVWRHFLEHGQFEGRLFRSAASPVVTPWPCLPPAALLMLDALQPFSYEVECCDPGVVYGVTTPLLMFQV